MKLKSSSRIIALFILLAFCSLNAELILHRHNYGTPKEVIRQQSAGETNCPLCEWGALNISTGASIATVLLFLTSNFIASIPTYLSISSSYEVHLPARGPPAA